MLNETTLSVYSSETVGTSSSTPQGRYTATVTQTDSGSLIYHSLLKSTSFERKSMYTLLFDDNRAMK